MANYRIPGPVCSSRQPWSIEDGTLARMLMPQPSPVCAASPAFEVICAAPPPLDLEPDLDFLFTQCRSPARGLSEDDYAAAAKSLDIEVAMIKAVAEIESPRGPFDSMGRPEILFERHYFHNFTFGKYDKTDPDISTASQGGYGKYSAQYGKLERAYALDPDAALRSVSWGRFQIMGNNFADAGFTSVAKFVLAMTKSEAEHLSAFVSFVKANPQRLNALRKKDWAGFAKRYNGAGYEKYHYDTKLAAAYKKFSAPPAAKPPAFGINP
jgi:hypothetical protein